MPGSMSRGLSSNDKLTIAAIVVFSSLLLLAWVYWVTKSAIALSILNLCSSLILFIILVPLQYIDCKRMYECRGEATSNLATVLGVMGSLLLISSYIMKTLNAFSSVGSSAQVVCAAIDFTPLFALPLAWIVCRAYEQCQRVGNVTAGLPACIGRAVEFPQDEGDANQMGYVSYQLRDASYQVGGDTYRMAVVSTFHIVRDAQGRMEGIREAPPRVFVGEGYVLGR